MNKKWEKVNLDAGWKVELIVDDDHHLTVLIGNLDGSQVFYIDEDWFNPPDVKYRFTTEQIEEEYLDEQ